MNRIEQGDFMEKVVYLLQHSYELENGCDETKVLGIFSSQQMAEEAVRSYRQLPGFRDKKADFCIDKYEVNKKYWGDGY